eukprot:TRINITY_DN58804_c0_g1_i1.p1 TRINITY_DN58804_c0_g1~~TRINITY_DN58804_c0_g1_i1.p1  ORF type:complete len:201 (+),score=17.31 TRINITY_DN58804_c0_g1_i1:64-603(+)
MELALVFNTVISLVLVFYLLLSFFGYGGTHRLPIVAMAGKTLQKQELDIDESLNCGKAYVLARLIIKCAVRKAGSKSTIMVHRTDLLEMQGKATFAPTLDFLMVGVTIESLLSELEPWALQNGYSVQLFDNCTYAPQRGPLPRPPIIRRNGVVAAWPNHLPAEVRIDFMPAKQSFFNFW